MEIKITAQEIVDKKDEIRFKMVHYHPGIEEYHVGRRVFSDLYAYYGIAILKDGDETASTILNESLLKAMEITEEDAYSIAMKNMEADADILDFLGMMVLSNESRVNGACQMLNISKLQEMANNFEDDLCIIPSSIHEVIIMPKKFLKGRDVKSMICEVNHNEVLPEEVLSDHPYYFSRKEGNVYEELTDWI